MSTKSKSTKATTRDSGAVHNTGEGLFAETEIDALEAEYVDGISSSAIVEIFTSRGVRLSEATFRKYIQQGLVPRSRRVGRKGKHRGSMGLYPSRTIRRINTLKRLMEDGFTIEEIQENFLRFADLLETIDQGLTELLTSFSGVIDEPRFDTRTRKGLSRELEETRKLSQELLGRIGEMAETLAEPPADRYRSSGAAGSAEDLL